MFGLHGRTHRLCRQRVASCETPWWRPVSWASAAPCLRRSDESTGGGAGSVVAPDAMCLQIAKQVLFLAQSMYKLPRPHARPRASCLTYVDGFSVCTGFSESL